MSVLSSSWLIIFGKPSGIKVLNRKYKGYTRCIKYKKVMYDLIEFIDTHSLDVISHTDKQIVKSTAGRHLNYCLYATKKRIAFVDLKKMICTDIH